MSVGRRMITRLPAGSKARLAGRSSEAVRAGDLAYTMARPVSYPLFQLASSLGNSAPRFLLNLLTASVVVGLGMRQLAGTPRGLPPAPGAGAISFLRTADCPIDDLPVRTV